MPLTSCCPGLNGTPLADLIPDTRLVLVRELGGEFFDSLRNWVLENFAAHEDVLMLFRESGRPAPYMEEFLFRTVVGAKLTKLLDRATAAGPGSLELEELVKVADQAKTWGVHSDEPALTRLVGTFLRRRFAEIVEAPSIIAARELAGFLDIAHRADQYPELWDSQNRYWDLLTDPGFMGRLEPETAAAFMDLGRKLGFSAPEEQAAG